MPAAQCDSDYNSQTACLSIFIHENILYWQIREAAPGTPGTWAWPMVCHNSPCKPNTRATPQSPLAEPVSLWWRNLRAKIRRGGWSTVALGTRASGLQAQKALNSFYASRQNSSGEFLLEAKSLKRNHMPQRKKQNTGHLLIITHKFEKWLGKNLIK